MSTHRYHSIVACTGFLLVLSCGPGGSPHAVDSLAHYTDASSPAEAGTTAAGNASLRAAPEAEDALRRVVDAYIRERTTEGLPYYIDSQATQFAGFEPGITRQEALAVCRAKFSAGTDVYYVDFFLERDINTYVITRIVLNRINAQAIQRTLYSRETLVL